MLSVYTKCCEVLLEVFQTDNNETQRISVEEYLNTQSNIKSDYCVQCKQWITVNERQQHINDNINHSVMQREMLAQTCMYHPYRSAIAFCAHCRIVVCCVCLTAFDNHKKHSIVLIKNYECNENVDEMERQCNLYIEQLRQYTEWLEGIITKKYSEYITCNNDNDNAHINGKIKSITLETFIQKQNKDEEQLITLSKGLLLYDKLFSLYSQLFNNYNNKHSILNYHNIIHNIYNKQHKFIYFHSLASLIESNINNALPIDKLNPYFFQPFPSLYTLHSLTSITVKDNLLCITGIKGNVLALGYADKMLFYSTQSALFQIGQLALGASCIKEGKGNLLYVSTTARIEIIDVDLSYTTYTVITVIETNTLDIELGYRLEPLGELITFNNDIVYYTPLSLTKNIFIYTVKDNNKDYTVDKIKPFELPILKVVLTNRQYPVLICCLQSGIKIIGYKTKVNLISINEDASYFPIEISDGTVLCLGKDDSVFMMGMSSVSTSNIVTLNNDSLGDYDGLKYGSLLLKGNDLLLYNGTSLNVAEFNEEKFALVDSTMELDLECKGDLDKTLIEFIKKDQYDNEYVIAIVNKSKCKLSIINVIKN